MGARIGGSPAVTTGQYEVEFLPTDDPIDTIYTMAAGDPGGARYPEPNLDDDGDGLKDEDPKNGLDDDGDGLIDEDFAAISQQHFRCTYSDTLDIIQVFNPDHDPLGLVVIQQSFQWTNPLLEDFVGLDFTICNVGTEVIEDVYLGFFADFDIPAPDGAEDDMAGCWQGHVQTPEDTLVWVSLAYMYDGSEEQPAPHYTGVVLLGHPTDPTGRIAPPSVNICSFQRFRLGVSFEEGGGPTNDYERYEVLSVCEHDANTQEGREDDYRILISSGPFASLAPEESLTYQMALVVGQSFHGMLRTAAEAVRTYDGVRYDRDGDPSNGKEYVVHWLHPSDAPVSTVYGELSAEVTDRQVLLQFDTNLEEPTELYVERRVGSGVPECRWYGEDLLTVGPGPKGLRGNLQDEDPVGWPRTYTLYHRTQWGDFLLDQVEVNLQQPTDLQLTVSPNPFNPRLKISYFLASPGPLQLDVYDLQGRHVRNLLTGALPAGQGSVVWQGRDVSGRLVASGVYRIRLLTEDRQLNLNVTLIR